jgi:hypothetical protein
MLGHIYIGTVGMEGAFEAMGSGSVDVNWAKQHHSLWLADQEAKGQSRVAPPGGRAYAARGVGAHAKGDAGCYSAACASLASRATAARAKTTLLSKVIPRLTARGLTVVDA